jgi:hypothetical protein
MYFSSRVSADRPINADVPEEEGPDEAAPTAANAEPESPTPAQLSPDSRGKSTRVESDGPNPAPPPPKAKRGRPRIPGALLLIGGLVVVAIGFIVLAVVAGSGGGPKGESTSSGAAPAPAPVQEEPASEEAPSPTPSSESSEGLGYPAFAMDNTTRVGGATAAENAAAVALAVFPSTTPKQRPAAVTLVDEEDWPVAIAAAVLMAPPLRAPLLFSGAEGAPEATEEALAALDPQGSKATGGAHGFAFGGATAPGGVGGFESIRPDASEAGPESPLVIAGAIAQLRDRLFGSPPDAVIVAPLDAPGFAMPAAAWAARSGDPVLFSEADSLSETTASALQRHADVPVYVLGPTSVISERVVHQIAAIGPKVKRVSGSDPVGTALALARYGDGGFGWNVNDPGHGFVLTRDDSPLDAAAAAALSASGTWGPLLLTDSAATLPAEVRSYFLDVKPGYTNNPTRAFYNHVWVIGDQEAIDVKQQAEANELAELAKIGEG